MPPDATIPALAAAPPATWRGELAALVRLAAPLAAANLLQMAVYGVDVIFVARLGTVEFAAATLGVFLFGLLNWALTSLAVACSPLIAAELGRRAHAVRDVRRSFRMALWLAVGTGLPAMLLLACAEPLFRLAGQDAQVAARSGAFLHVLLWALIPNIVAAVMRTVAAALGRPGWAMLVAAGGVLTGLLTNWLFVFGRGGFPAMGLEGSALASLVTALAMAATYALILCADRRLRRYRLFGRWWRAEWPRLVQIVRLGTPIALSVLLEAGLFGGASILMGLIGVVDVAAHAIAINVASVAFQLPVAVGQAATIRVGLGFGAGDLAWQRRAGWTAIVFGTAIMLVSAALMWTVPRFFVGIYLDPGQSRNVEVAALAVRLLAVAALFQLFDGAQAVTAGALRGRQDTRVPMLICAIGYWGVGFPVAIGLGFRTPLAAVGIWIGLAAGLAVVSALLLWRWRRGQLARPATA